MGPTTDQNISDAALSSPDDAMQGTDLACDPEQLDYPARPLTPDHPLQGSDLAGNLVIWSS